MVRAAVADVHPLVATTVVDLLDTVSGCILAGLGVSPAESRSTLDAQWGPRRVGWIGRVVGIVMSVIVVGGRRVG